MRLAICISQILLLTLGTPGFCSAIESSVGPLSYNDLVKLSQSEQIWFGTVHKSLPSSQRIDALELAIFGQHSHGTDSARLAAICAVLNSGKGSMLMPPEAPRLGTAGASVSSSLPPIAPELARTDTASGDAVKAMLKQALKLYSQGNIEEAKTAFERVLAVQPKSVDAYFNLGAIAESQGDLTLALDDYERASEFAPDDTDIRSAVIQTKSKLSRAGSKNQDKSNYLTDSQWNTLKDQVNDAAVAYKNGSYDQAVEILQRVQKQAPERADVIYALSQAYRAQGKYLDARTAISQAIAIDPNNQTYKSALSDLNRQVASLPVSKPPANGFDTIASDGQSDAKNNQTPGEITPFSSAGAPVGWQSAGGYDGFGGSSYYPGYANRTHTLRMNRIQRVAIGSLAGASFGAMLGGSYRGGSMKGALVGGLAGGLFGLLSGH
jgi:tetratricopeptide (TPR) repeat protein